MESLAFGLFIASGALASVLEWRSMRRLSDTGRARRRARGLRIGPWFGRREDFTPEGWRQRWAMVVCMLLAAAALMFWSTL